MTTKNPQYLSKRVRMETKNRDNFFVERRNEDLSISLFKANRRPLVLAVDGYIHPDDKE